MASLLMLARVLVCVTIVAAFSVGLEAAPPISEDVTVPAEVIAVARALGLEPPRDRARFVAEFARLLYTPPLGKSPALAALLNPKLIEPDALKAASAMVAPVPLSADVWSRAIFRRPTPADRLVSAIMSDRRAALLCYSLAALDDETLDFFAQHPALLGRLYENGAPAFAAFASSLRVRENRLVPPGGPDAAPLWEGILRERTSEPEEFVRALFQLHDGRVAYLYDLINQLDAPRRAFALGSWMSDPALRLVRFQALVDVTTRSYREWRLATLPFSRPLHDLSLLLMRLQVEPTGVPASPGSRAFWSEVFAGDDLNPASVSFSDDPAAAAPLDAAWLAETTSGSDMFWRGDRLDQFAFGQRMFRGAPQASWPAAVSAIRGFSRQRMLSLTLERMGIRSPATFSFVARQAARMTGGNPNHLFWTLAQTQSALALLCRSTLSGTVSLANAERLVTALFTLPIEGDRRYGAVAGWLRRDLLPLMPRAATDDPANVVESQLIAGLAGPDPGRSARLLLWEGQQYRVDVPHGERHRLQTVRDKQHGYSVDVAMALDDAARALASDNLTLDRVRQVAADLANLPEVFGRRLTAAAESRAPGVEESRPLSESLARFNEELARSVRGNDVRRAARLAPSLMEAGDAVLADALLSIAYAADLGDPDGAAMLARNVAMRHDFGFGRKDGDVRVRSVWAVPRQDFLPGVPWHVSGSVLGLDIAMASLMLRRISPDLIADAPHLPSNERDAFAIGLAAMNARLLKDEDRDAIVAAIRRGQARVAGLRGNAASFDEIADAIAMDGWRRRAVRWMIGNDPEYLSEMFALTEFMALGGGVPAGVNVDAWGSTALQSEGCACLRVTYPSSWRLLAGRPQMAFVAAGIADLNLHIASELAELQLPAALAKAVLGAAVLDFIEGVAPTDANDWWSVARAARAVPRELIEDYVAAAAAVDGPLVPDETESNQP